MPVNGVMCYREEEAGSSSFPYMICGFTPESGLKASEEYKVVDIPKLKWAVFTTEEHIPDQTVAQIQNLWKRIYTEWFPTSSYEPLSGPQFEMYGIAESGMPYCEVWIPVEHK